MQSAELSESIELSETFFRDHRSYATFDLTSDRRAILDCIEPRDADGVPHGEYKTTIQTPGGAAGEGLDAAVALTISEGRLVTIDEGMATDQANRPLMVFGVHHDCTYMKYLASVTGEMASPSDFTKDTIDRYAGFFNERELVQRSLGRVMMASDRITEDLGEDKHMDRLIKRSDELYPHHTNVKHVRGPSLSRTYVTNLHPMVGKNRNRKPFDPQEAIKIQAHHDSLAANVAYLRNENNLDSETRGNRLVSMLARSAATRTVVISGWEQATLLDVRPAIHTKSGLTISGQKYAGGDIL